MSEGAGGEREQAGPGLTAGAVDVAIVHEWLTSMSGSERVVEALREAFPQSHVYASVLDGDRLPGWATHTSTSWLQRIPLVRRSHSWGLPLMPLAMRGLRIAGEPEVVIRSFHTFATRCPAPSDVPEVIYCHTPPRFLHRRTSMRGERALVRWGSTVAGGLLGPGDRRRVRRASVVVANSQHVAGLVRSVYDVRAVVVHPPVDVDRFSVHVGQPADYFVLFGRLVPYKRPDIAIEAFRGLPHRLVVIGDGRLRRTLAASAPANVEFRGHVDDAELPGLLAGARAVLQPGEEDFGIAAVEALSAGAPVIAYASGGALDYVVDGVNGLLVREQSPAAFAAAVVAATERTWDRAEISRSVDHFGAARFVAEMRAVVQSAIRSRGR